LRLWLSSPRILGRLVRPASLGREDLHRSPWQTIALVVVLLAILVWRIRALPRLRFIQKFLGSFGHQEPDDVTFVIPSLFKNESPFTRISGGFVVLAQLAYRG
jgi:hypothetical protein